MASILIVDDHQNEGKIENHLKPLADHFKNNKMICITPNEAVTNLNYVQVPTFGKRLVGISLLFPYSVLASLRDDFDVTVAISLIPYGLYALLLKFLFRTPAHLVIIGGDIDSHADKWYGGIVRRLLTNFDSLSVLGTAHKQKLVEMGIPEEQVFILSNSVDVTTFQPAEQPIEYDFIWVGRFSKEKNPLLFIEALAEYASQADPEFKGVLVGDGTLRNEVENAVVEYGLSENIEITGWVDDPAEYYQKSKIFVMTSNREAMGLTLIEAMCCGLPPIAPNIGNISDVVDDQKNGILLNDMDPESLCSAMIELNDSHQLYRKFSEQVIAIRGKYDYTNASQDWHEIIKYTIR